MGHIISQNGVVTTISFDVLAGWEKWFLLMSDNHFDSVYSNRNLMTKHLEEAKDRNARIVIFGDWFDAMQGRFDPRRSMSELKPEYRREDYYDFVVKDSRDFLLPYAHLIDVLSDGNHELAVLKNANTNLMDRLVGALNIESGYRIVHGGFGGWIRLMFNISTILVTKKIKYFHGAGSDAPVTRGVIQTNRQAVYLPDANIVVNGHNHNQYYLAISRERINSQGTLFFDLQHHVRIPGYKQAYGDGSAGWEVTRGAPPKPIGAVWTRFYCENHDIKIQIIPDIIGGDPISVDSSNIYDGVVFEEDREGE